MSQQVLDTFTSAILQSSYFGGLVEYGVGSPSFAGGFLPSSLCPQKAPALVGFYDPFNTSIIGFLQCELDHGGIPQGSQVIYNIILPAGSLESDLFGNVTACEGFGPSWHFHQTPYSPGFALGAGLAVVGTATSGDTLPGFLIALASLQGGPIYTISSADARCSEDASFIDNLLHEMVEAASNPYPQLSVVMAEFSSGGIEIVDVADTNHCQPTAAFVPAIPAMTTPDSHFTSKNVANSFNIKIPQYWSNASQKCVTGFTDLRMPSGPGSPNLSVTTTGNGADLIFTITGNHFGQLPSTSSDYSLPYIGIQDTTQSWQAGNSLNGDFVTLRSISWTDTAVVVEGLNFPSGNLVIQPNDQISVWLCNPASGKCGVGNLILKESGVPQLKVSEYNSTNVYLAYDIKVDGTIVASNIGGGESTRWLDFSGRHVVSESATSNPALFTPDFGSCGENGSLTLSPGDNQMCSIVNSAGRCPADQHCCGAADTTVGCVAGCVSNSISCGGCGTAQHCCSTTRAGCAPGQCFPKDKPCP